MMPLVPVVFICTCILAAVPCLPECTASQLEGHVNDSGYVFEAPTDCWPPYYSGAQLCHDEPIVEHEFRSKLMEPLAAYCKPSNVLYPSPECHRDTFYDEGWECKPLVGY